MLISMEICPTKNPALTMRDSRRLNKLVQNKLFPLNNSKNYTLRQNGFTNINALKNLPKLKKEKFCKFNEIQNICRFQEHMHFGELWDKQNYCQQSKCFQQKNHSSGKQNSCIHNQKQIITKNDYKSIFAKDQVPLTYLQQQKSCFQERFRQISNQIQKKKKSYLEQREKKSKLKQQRRKRKHYTNFFNPLLKTFQDYATSKSIKSSSKLANTRNRQIKQKTEHKNNFQKENRIKKFIQQFKGPSITCYMSEQKKGNETPQQIDFDRLKFLKPNMGPVKMQSYINKYQLSNVSTNTNFKLKRLQTLVKKKREDQFQMFQLTKSRQKQRTTDPSLISAKLRLASNHKKMVGVVKQIKGV